MYNKILKYNPKYNINQIEPHPDLVTIYTIRQQSAALEFIRKFGITKPIVISYKTDYVLDGFLEAQIALRLGIETVPTVHIDLSPEEEVSYIATINSIHKATLIDKEKLDELYKNSIADKDFLKYMAKLNILPLEGTGIRKRRTKIFEETEFFRENTVKGRNTAYRFSDIIIYGPTNEIEDLVREITESIPLTEFKRIT